MENENTKVKRKRSSKTTRTQYMLYLGEQLTRSLNSSGGPQRSTNAWKRIFSDWKSAVRKKARALKVGQAKTGGGPPEKPLNDLEHKLIDLLGAIVIDGIADVPELGLLTNVSTVNTTVEALSDKLSIEPKTNPAVSKIWTSSEHGSVPPKKNLNKPVKKRSTFVSSVQNYLKNHVEVDYTPILSEINHNSEELVATAQQKLKLNYLRLQLQYPDVDIERSLTDE